MAVHLRPSDQTILLIAAGPTNAPKILPLLRIGVIMYGDFNLLWKNIGIDLMRFNPGSPDAPEGFRFPLMYAMQNYVDYQYYCPPDKMDALLAEISQAEMMVRSRGGKRALVVLGEAAKRMKDGGRGIVFRGGLGEYRMTSSLPN